MDYSSSEIKSGFFVIISIVLLLILTFVVGNYLGSEQQEWQIRFGYLNGLEENAQVYFAGREVGKVSQIEVIKENPRPILLTIQVSDAAYIREDSESFIDTLGMMGEKIVEISHGSVDSPALKSGTIIEGTDPIPMYLLISKMNLLTDQVTEMCETLNPLLADTKTLLAGSREELAKIISNFYEVSINVRDMTHDLKLRPWRLIRKG